MTTNTTKDHQPDAKSNPASEPPIAGKAQPGPGAPNATSAPDLESRIGVRRVEMVAKLRTLRADKRMEALEAADKLKAKLSELSHILKWGVVDGWASIGDNVTNKLEDWLAESARQLPIQSIPAGTGQS